MMVSMMMMMMMMMMMWCVNLLDFKVIDWLTTNHSRIYNIPINILYKLFGASLLTRIDILL